MLKLRKGLRVENLRLPFKKALPVAAELGAEGIEVNARSEFRPGEISKTGVRHIRKMLEDHNLTICSLQFPTRRGYAEASDLEARIEATKAAMRLAYELGCGHVSNFVGRIDLEDQSNILQEALTDLGIFGTKVGARFAIRTGPADGETLKGLLARLPMASIAIDFDPAELIINEKSPGEVLKDVGEHVVHFRARDAVRDLSLGQGIPVQLGRGSVDLAELLSVLEEKHYGGFLTIDQPGINDAIIENHESLEYLQQLFA